MKLNCDLGEGFGPWRMGADELVMPHIDMANIACGGHAGDPLTMLNTVLLAKKHNVEIGAHPSYPDKLGFGRKSIPFAQEELIAHIIAQVSSLIGIVSSESRSVSYVKPHGALYNDMMKDESIRKAVFNAVSSLHSLCPNLKLMLQSSALNQLISEQAKTFKLELIFEAFADRQYDNDGLLMPRNIEGAVLNETQMFEQISLLKQGKVKTNTGKILSLHVDSLCVHGDNETAVAQIKQIRTELLG